MTKRLFLSIAIILCAVTIIKAQKSAESNTSGGWIGLTTSASGNGTVTVTDVVSGGPAEQAGMKTGYVVTQVNGASIQSRDEFEAAVARSAPGTKLSIGYRVGMSGAWEATRVITVGKRPESGVVDRTPPETETSAKSAVASSALLPKNQRVTASESPSAPSILTNSDVLGLLKIGVSSEIISAKLKYSSTSFDTSPAALQQLKLAGASDGLMMAMVQAAPVSTSQAIDPNAKPVTAPAPARTNAPSDGKTRVFVTDSQSWETRGGGSAGGNKNAWGANSWIAGGARPQTAEVIKTLNQRCPEITVTNNVEKADFVLTLDHEGGKGLLAHRNKIAVFNRDGDDIFSASTRELGNSVKDACQVMLSSKR